MLNRIKLLLLVSIVLFSFSVFPIGTSAEKIGNKEKVIQRFTEIKDINKLYERAKNGVSDVNREVEKNFVAKVVVFCNRKVQRNAIKNAEVCHPFNSFSTMRGTVYSSRHEKR
ncbi:hypothetical protein NSQ96_01265 [Caldifermentibacillus hisashii]|uniref:hypothetical protein n=1 Tax=Caldifermentibacillus hisashii TaxID=996558 RepID=UPI0031FC24E0